MTPTDQGPLEQVQFQLAVPADLAHELAALPDISVEPIGTAPERVQHELALETVVAIVTIAVGAKELWPTCMRVAEHIHGFFSRSRDREPRFKVIGESEETVLEIHLGDAAATAQNIRIVVTR